jgi:hypothetical protein
VFLSTPCFTCSHADGMQVGWVPVKYPDAKHRPSAVLITVAHVENCNVRHATMQCQFPSRHRLYSMPVVPSLTPTNALTADNGDRILFSSDILSVWS